ncbi:MAG: aminotransferase class I/II-fold pyridoxal phosphate-dependent enzyme [Coriobacteriia bacterium]|nr:aminotransferase class I/II-fold pyridoxal phosphate-dependent enzyme [Coriobacteriia bacterium]
MSIDLNNVGFGTLSIHSGSTDAAEGALSFPIYQTSTFCFDTVEQGTARFMGQEAGYCYTRGGNPTTNSLAQKIAALEKGESAVVTSSGMGAIGGVLVGLLKAGDHVVCGDCVYGCTDLVMHKTLAKFGVEVEYVDMTDPENVRRAMRPNTAMVYFESATNPMMTLTDTRAIAAIAREHGAKVVVDNTFCPPPIQYPLLDGADIVVHSTTKYINGHGDVIGGAIVGSADDIANIGTNATSKLCGTTPSPFDCFLVSRGLMTMELRMQRHCQNAQAVAEYLESNDCVDVVYYPGLPSHPQHELACQLEHEGFGGILSFELKDGIAGMSSYEAARKLVNALQIAKIAVSLGDPETLIQHPASMTHHNVDKEDRIAMGITDGTIRLSCGLENTQDLIADFQQAFAQLTA